MAKKIVSGIAALVMAAGIAATSVSAQKLGDVNGESRIDIEDAVSVINHVNGQKSVGYYGSASADVNSDGKIDIEDAVLIINNINGLSAIEDKDVSPAKVEMSVDRLLSRSRRELTALSYDDYEYVMMQGQGECYGFKCAAFPNYVFSVEQRYEKGKPDGSLQVPVNIDPNKHMNMYGSAVTQIDLYKGAYIGDGVTVGMTYNEIKEVLGQDIKIHIDNSSLRYSANATIDGRHWSLHFDLTEEQINEIQNRINAIMPEYAEGKVDYSETPFIDISDMNPVCDIAVYLRW